MKKIAVFASGNGSNFQAIVDAVAEGKLHAEVACLISDQPSAHVILRAEKSGIPAYALSPKSYENKADYEQAILTILKSFKVDYIVLAGYMRLIGPTLLTAFEHNIVNIHPSLLPAFPGLHAIEKAYKSGATITGVTIHYVDAGMDTGPIIAQQSIEIDDTDTLESIEKRVHSIEHQLYPAVLHKLLNEEKGVHHD